MKSQLILEFKSEKAKKEFIGGLLDGWGEGVECINVELQQPGNNWVVDNTMKISVYSYDSEGEVV